MVCICGRRAQGGIASIEAELTRAASLAAKLPGHVELTRALLHARSGGTPVEPVVPASAVPTLHAMLVRRAAADAATTGTPEPDAAEYVLRTVAARPAVRGARPTVQRMYVAVQGEQWRVAVALSGDLEA